MESCTVLLDDRQLHWDPLAVSLLTLSPSFSPGDPPERGLSSTLEHTRSGPDLGLLIPSPTLRGTREKSGCADGQVSLSQVCQALHLAGVGKAPTRFLILSHFSK